MRQAAGGHGIQRDTTATASIGGVPVAGISSWVSINNGRGHTVSLCHASTC